jgi:HK97 family phage major capsid protein
MENIFELMDERGDVQDRLEVLVNTAHKRTLTADEKAQFNAYESQIKTFDATIKKLQEQDRASKDRARNKFGSIDNTDRKYLDKARTISIIDNQTKLARPRAMEDDEPEVSLGELILARIRGPQNEAERKALSTTLDASGGISTMVSRNFWDSMRAASTVVRAGAQVLDFEDIGDGVVKIPQITGDPTAYWKVQNEQVTLSDPTVTAKSFDFKSLFAATQISNELAQDGGSLFAQMIEASLTRSFASEIDRVALLGSGSGEEPEGVGLKAINEFEMGTNGNDLADFNPLVGACKLLMDDNVPLNRINGFIMAPRTWQELATLKSATELQQLMIPEQIASIPWYVSSKIPVNTTVGSSADTSTIYVGDWTQLVIGVRLNIRIKFHDQPLAQNFATLVTCATRVDVEAMNLGAFCKITGITPGPALT